MKEAIILGSGPAALLAALAATHTGHSPRILALGERSVMGGAQFLHEPIPELHQDGKPDKTITFRLAGTAEGYAAKVYRDKQLAPSVSFGAVHDGKAQDVWNLAAAYDQLWDRFSDQIEPFDASENDLYSLPAKTITTVPAKVTCQSERHIFAKARVWISVSPGIRVPEGEVWYSGQPADVWYRRSTLWGISYTEFPDVGQRGGESLVRVDKPLYTTCTCYPHLLRAGRYGTWTKGVLTHDAYWSTRRFLSVKAAT